MGVDHPRQHEQPARVDLLAPAGKAGTELGDQAVGHRDVPGLAADHEVVAHGTASATRSRMIATISSIAARRSASASFPRRRS